MLVRNTKDGALVSDGVLIMFLEFRSKSSPKDMLSNINSMTVQIYVELQ